MIILILNLYFLLQLLIGVINMTDKERLKKLEEKINEMLNQYQYRAEMLDDDAWHDANSNSKFHKEREAQLNRGFFQDLCRLLDIVR